MTTVETAPEREEVMTVEQESDRTGVWWWIRTIGSWLLLFVAVAVLAVLVVVPRLTGATAYTVLTGSMEPTLPPGTLIVVKEVPATELVAGDVITFQMQSGDPAVNTHRIVQVAYDSQGTPRFATQGDANEHADEGLLVPEQVRGRLWYSVPYLGHANTALAGENRDVVVNVLGGALIVYAVWAVGSGVADGRRKRAGRAEMNERERDDDVN